MGGLDLLGSFQVGDGAADFEDAAVSAGTMDVLEKKLFQQSVAS